MHTISGADLSFWMLGKAEVERCGGRGVSRPTSSSVSGVSLLRVVVDSGGGGRRSLRDGDGVGEGGRRMGGGVDALVGASSCRMGADS